MWYVLRQMHTIISAIPSASMFHLENEVSMLLRNVYICQTIRRNIPEDCILGTHRSENLKYYTSWSFILSNVWSDYRRGLVWLTRFTDHLYTHPVTIDNCHAQSSVLRLQKKIYTIHWNWKSILLSCDDCFGKTRSILWCTYLSKRNCIDAVLFVAGQGSKWPLVKELISCMKLFPLVVERTTSYENKSVTSDAFKRQLVWITTCFRHRSPSKWIP
jgi:hypothetical protein